MTGNQQWIYLFGEQGGADIKIGRSKDSDLRIRLRGVNGEQTTTEQYVLLAGVAGIAGNENALKTHFAHLRRADKGARTEYFRPDPELVEYANWLRSQWFITDDGTEPLDAMPFEDASHWLPGPDRRIARPNEDPTKLVQEYDTLPGNLAGTAWSWMVNPKASIQDYFTPTEIIDAARMAMGDIDLDAASHYLANKRHKIRDWFHINRSAFDNPWYGRVWLNPPYGDNEPWFREIHRYVISGEVEQLCMLSPMWTFGTQIARPVMELSTAFIVLTPTPKFWGNANPAKIGSNQPHAVMYIGEHPDRFLKAFRAFGLPLTFRWDLIEAASYEKPGQPAAIVGGTS